MSRTTDPTNFFQSAAALEDLDRKARKSKNTYGDPITLPSKILAVIAAPEREQESRCVYVAESAGTTRRVVLDTKNISHIYRGPLAPLTSLAFSPDCRTLFAGCWDKSIWSWDVKSKRPGRRYFGHADFVKSVVCVRVASNAHPTVQGQVEDSVGVDNVVQGAEGGGLDLLLSGSADASIIVWDIATGRKLHVLTGHTRGILDLTVDPISTIPSTHNDDDDDNKRPTTTTITTHEPRPPKEITLFSAGSDREIRRWRISATSSREITNTTHGEDTTSSSSSEIDVANALILAHETSVNKLFFPPLTTTTSDADDCNLYTASSDTYALCLLRSSAFQTSETRLPHPDFVRDVVLCETAGVVVTACRDEGVRVWDAATGELGCVYEGHYEEVTGLCLVGAGREVVSVSIDGTVRRWGLGREQVSRWREGELERREKEARGEEDVVAEEGKKGESLLTEEEERELAELMGEDDE